MYMCISTHTHTFIYLYIICVHLYVHTVGDSCVSSRFMCVIEVIWLRVRSGGWIVVWVGGRLQTDGNSWVSLALIWLRAELKRRFLKRIRVSTTLLPGLRRPNSRGVCVLTPTLTLLVIIHKFEPHS